jgi:hypothetical protein
MTVCDPPLPATTAGRHWRDGSAQRRGGGRECTHHYQTAHLTTSIPSFGRDNDGDALVRKWISTATTRNKRMHVLIQSFNVRLVGLQRSATREHDEGIPSFPETFPLRVGGGGGRLALGDLAWRWSTSTNQRDRTFQSRALSCCARERRGWYQYCHLTKQPGTPRRPGRSLVLVAAVHSLLASWDHGGKDKPTQWSAADFDSIYTSDRFTRAK